MKYIIEVRRAQEHINNHGVIDDTYAEWKIDEETYSSLANAIEWFNETYAETPIKINGHKIETNSEYGEYSKMWSDEFHKADKSTMEKMQRGEITLVHRWVFAVIHKMDIVDEDEIKVGLDLAKLIF